MRPLGGPNFMLAIPTLLLIIKQWVQAPQLQISISKMDWCATCVTSVFLQASMQRWFWNPIIVEWQDILEWTRQWLCCKSTFIGWNFNRTSANISDRALPAPSPNQPLRSRNCTHPYRHLTSPGRPYKWITCPTYHLESMEMISFLWLLIGSLKVPFRQLARRISQLMPWPRSSLSVYWFILGFHRQSFMIRIAVSLVHFGPTFGHFWTPSSPNTLPSIPKWIR